jgi:tetratricopeptide (TPR) repeat protein
MFSHASGYDSAGRYRDALKLREEIFKLRTKVDGPDHPNTLWAMNALAASYGGVTGHRNDALKLREELVARRKKVNGPEHPDTLWAMGDLACSYADAGRRDESLKLREQKLQLMSQVHGQQHPATIGAMENLAASYTGVGRTDEAIKLFTEAQQVGEKQHRSAFDPMTGLAIAYATASRFDAARISVGTPCFITIGRPKFRVGSRTTKRLVVAGLHRAKVSPLVNSRSLR